MASASALTIAIFASQVSMGLAQSCPLDQGKLACADTVVGCGCADMGYTNLGGTIKCKAAPCEGQSNGGPTQCEAATATAIWCGSSCCKPTANCVSLAETLDCGAGKRLTIGQALNTAGTTTAEQITNCCSVIPTVKCAAVNCASDEPYMKAVTAQADTVITSCDDSKCCERDILTCGGQKTHTCGTGKQPRALLGTTTGRNSAYLPLAGTAFTNAADYITNCCEATPAKGKCSAHTCPTYMKKKTSPATDCMSTVCGDTECCEYSADTCVTQSAKCTQPDVIFDFTAATGKTFKVGDDDTKIQTACCVVKPAPTTPTCSDFFSALAASAKAAESASGAYGQAASFAMLAVGGLVAVAM